MFRNVGKRSIRFSVVFLLILGIIGTSLITGVPVPTEEAEAGFAHKCCDVICRVDGFGRVHCDPYNCVWLIHWPFRPDPC